MTLRNVVRNPYAPRVSLPVEVLNRSGMENHALKIIAWPSITRRSGVRFFCSDIEVPILRSGWWTGLT